ncbi:hypothetical protein ACSBR2_037440 [Camellia fascicularis]
MNHQAKPTSGFTNETDREALIAIKDLVTSDPSQFLSSWTDSIHFCNWHGVTCGSRHQRVTVLNMSSLHLSGSLAPHIGNLTFLRKNFLLENNFHGIIPQEIGRLLRLRNLSLRNNSFQGEFPTNLTHYSSITEFDVYNKQLVGKIPTHLGSLSTLLVLDLARNRFTGAIPPSLGDLSGVVKFSVENNNLEGNIPFELGQLSKVEFFALGSNNLSGNLHDLQVFSIYDNLFRADRGELMNFLTSLSNCSKLRALELSKNHFEGSLTHSIVNLSTKLNSLLLDTNYISGIIPPWIENLAGLWLLGLAENKLTGSIPDSIGKLSNLEELYIYTNNISGKIPSSIGNLSRLNTLFLSNNMLEGSMPISMGNCTNLQNVDLGYNHLNGAIPEEIVSLSSLSILFAVYHNYLTGKLPSQVGNLRYLGVLDVSENKLIGEIPTALGSCQLLEFLYMEGNLFEGTIPASFKLLKGIQVLDLSRNNLSGHIPRFLGEFTSIYDLNLSYNKFEGEVPNEGVFKNISAFSVVGNNKLCGGIKELQLPVCPTKVLEKRRKPINHRVIIPLVITLVIVLLLLCLLVIFYLVRRSRQQSSLTSPLQNQYPKLSYAELLQATNGFSLANLIGEGRYGSVFKGILNSGEQIVAVKVLNLLQRGANRSFLDECEALRNIRHRNLIKIITSCSSIDFKGNDFKALVFKFMSNGSLESWLHQSLSDQQDPKNLNLVQRLNIAIDVASALDYLHHHCETAIIHCDLKPSNVLLDDDLCAHVGDFGLARILSATANISTYQQSSSIGIRGTVGYVAPEYGMGAEISTQGDMYSYGVFLLEMFTEKRPTNNMFTDNINLHSYTRMAFPDRVMEIVDPKIIVEAGEEASRTKQRSTTNIGKVKVCLALVLQIGVSCSDETPRERMNAKDVLTELHKVNVFLGVMNEGHRYG